MKKLAQGAEATLFLHEGSVLKERRVKSYRHPAIDAELRKLRTRHEAKVLGKLQGIGFPAPRVVQVDEEAGQLVIEFVDGALVRDVFDKRYTELAAEIGKKVAQLHTNDIIHGDLTTSNMILSKATEGIFFIDFGLSFFSQKVEDRAVDLHLLDRALESKHFSVYPACMEIVLENYKRHYKEADAVLQRYKAVQRRGRYKERY